MNRINCLIVDDEPISRDIVEGYCAHLPYLHVVGSCDNAIKAKMALQQQKVDIMFLDINMPVMDGISFLKTMRHPPKVIFTTAYKEYAVEAFDLSAVDYLLKPFSLDRFIVAVDKAVEKMEPAIVTEVSGMQEAEQYFFVKTDGKIYRVVFKDVLYAEASGNYTKIVTSQNMLMPAMTFAALAGLLPANQFIRIHRSFIVNRLAIGHIEGNRVYINNAELPIGSNYKEQFFKLLGLH